jgi:hypothetical protein
MSKVNFILITGLTEALYGEGTVKLPILSEAFQEDCQKMVEALDEHWPAVSPSLKKIPGMMTDNKKLDKKQWAEFLPKYQATLAAEEVSAELWEQASALASNILSAEAAINRTFAAAVTALPADKQTYEGWAELVEQLFVTDDSEAPAEATPETPAETIAETVETATEVLGTEEVAEIATEAITEAATEIVADLTEAEQAEVIQAATEQSGGVVPATADDAIVALMGGVQQIFELMEAQADAAAKTSQVVSDVARSLATLSESNTTVMTAMARFLGQANGNLQVALKTRMAPSVDAPQLAPTVEA